MASSPFDLPNTTSRLTSQLLPSLKQVHDAEALECVSLMLCSLKSCAWCPQALTLEALESMPDEERYGLLGNSLYPRVMGITGEAGLAGKVTGMLLELPLEKLHALVQEASSEASLAEVVKEAQAVLPSPASPDSITAASAQLEASRGDDKLCAALTLAANACTHHLPTELSC